MAKQNPSKQAAGLKNGQNEKKWRRMIITTEDANRDVFEIAVGFVNQHRFAPDEWKPSHSHYPQNGDFEAEVVIWYFAKRELRPPR